MEYQEQVVFFVKSFFFKYKMCLHLGSLFQVHRWTQICLVPENQIVYPWKFSIFIPVCSFKYFRSTPSSWRILDLSIDIDVFGLYQDQWTLQAFLPRNTDGTLRKVSIVT